MEIKIPEGLEIIKGGVTAAKGFFAASCAAGIKYQGRDDMALVYSKEPATVAGVFTKNIYAAAPVLYDRLILSKAGTVHAVVLNSGIANAATGSEGSKMNLFMASAVADELGIDSDEVLTASTGVIGYQLPKEPISRGASLLKAALSASVEAGTNAEKAIMTTDTVPKEAACSFTVDGKKVTVGGMSKGSGMIHPDMATMLSVVTTDARIDRLLLQEIVSEVVEDSFNMISVDRDTSTNDTYIVLANSESEVSINKGSNEYSLFRAAVEYVAKSLARQMAADGEGATKLLEVTVAGAGEKKAARVLARTVVASNLVKSMVFGCDANSGRILDALGYAGVRFDPDRVDVSLIHGDESIAMAKDGVILSIDEEKAAAWMSEDEVCFLCDLKQGEHTATAWGCDLTYDYVKINGDYRS